MGRREERRPVDVPARPTRRWGPVPGAESRPDREAYGSDHAQGCVGKFGLRISRETLTNRQEHRERNKNNEGPGNA